jgi:hypothetical protein
MTEPRDSDSEMPTFPFPWPTRPDARAVDALLAGPCQPEEAPAELRAVAEVFAALRAPAGQREVAGWGQALSTYRGMAVLPEAPSRSRRQRPGLIAAPLNRKLAGAAAVAVLAVLSGGVAAAYTDHLPVFLQRVAHATIAAPGVRETHPTPTPNGSVHPVGPSATGSAAYGLCRAYQQAEEHGNAGQKSVAFRNLVSAAGGAGQVTAYCAAVQHPGPDHSSAGPPGRRVGQSGSPGHSPHPQRTKPTPPGKKEHGGGNQHGKQSP